MSLVPGSLLYVPVDTQADQRTVLAQFVKVVLPVGHGTWGDGHGMMHTDNHTARIAGV